MFRPSQFFILAGFALTVASAHANVVIEPIIGGQFSGELDGQFKSSTTTDTGTFSSLVYGGRVGLNYQGFLIGAEYLGDNNMSVKFDGTNGWGATSTNATMSNANYGGFLGIEFMQPLSLRLIGTFFAVSNAHLTHYDSTGKLDTDQNLIGYGYKGELSARIARWLTLGVSYYQLIYTDTKDNIASTSSPLVPVGTQHAVITQISIPLEF